MATDHRPIAGELVASPPPHAPTTADAERPCIACGSHHGSVGREFACLRAELARVRAELRRVLEELAGARELGALGEGEIVRLRAVVDVDQQRLREFARELAARSAAR